MFLTLTSKIILSLGIMKTRKLWSMRGKYVLQTENLFLTLKGLAWPCTAKGQLISRCLFGLPKNEQKQIDLRYHTSKVDFFFVRFLGELKIPKIHFEIN